MRRLSFVLVFFALACGSTTMSSDSGNDGGAGGGDSTGGGTGGGAGGTGGSGFGGGTGGFGGGSGLPCNTQPEAACLTRTDCLADYCFECSCSPTYLGCRDPSAMKATCPMLNCPQPKCCLNTGDCGGTNVCIGPGQSNCGVCQSGDCSSDSDCTTTGTVCAPAQCLCSGGLPMLCQAACTSTSCPEGQACEANGHCTPKVCLGDSNCTRSFKCDGVDGGAGHCVRRTCGSPLECLKGTFCVEGGCSSGEGTCEALNP